MRNAVQIVKEMTPQERDEFCFSTGEFVDQVQTIESVRAADPGLAKIDKFRQIVREHAMMKVDGVRVDAQSANAVITVYDSLRPDNQRKFAKFPVLKMCKIAWLLLKPKKN